MSKIASALLVLTLTSAVALRAYAADPSPAPSAGADEKTVTTASGLKYTDSKVGVGPMPTKGQTVAFTYVIFLGQRKMEESRPGEPMRFTLGKEEPLKGLAEGVSTMRVGGVRHLIVPPALAYGAEGAGRVPPNATLDIDVELLEIH